MKGRNGVKIITKYSKRVPRSAPRYGMCRIDLTRITRMVAMVMRRRIRRVTKSSVKVEFEVEVRVLEPAAGMRMGDNDGDILMADSLIVLYYSVGWKKEHRLSTPLVLEFR